MKILITLCLLYLSVGLFSQTLEEGERLFNEQNYSEAAAVYENLMKKKPKDLQNKFRLARCYYELGRIDEAQAYFETTREKFPQANKFLARLYVKNYDFDKAADAYKRFIATLQDDENETAEFTKKMYQAQNAAEMLGRVEEVNVIDSVIIDKSDFLKAYRFLSDVGKLEIDNQQLNTIKYTTQRGDRSFFAKQSANQNLYLFTAYRLLDKWTDAMQLSSEINTQHNENYPFMMSDGITLYFASDGEKSIGGYDIFVTRFNPNKNDYFTPENVGMPFNSPYNDYMMAFDDTYRIGWFASDRFQTAEKVTVYSFVPNDEKRIIRCENADSLKLFAQLKLFRKAQKIEFSTSKNVENSTKLKPAAYSFAVNDNLIYNSLDDFKNETAATLAKQLLQEEQNLQQTQYNLEMLRNNYAQAANEDEKNAFAPRILLLETATGTLEEKIKNLTADIRKLENSEVRSER